MSFTGNSALRSFIRTADQPPSRDLSSSWAWALLALACGAYAGLAFWTTRGVSFDHDELRYFVEGSGFSPAEILEPYNGHLIAGTRFIYASTLEVFGSSYAPVKALMIASVIACAVLMFALLRRPVGRVLALTAAIVVLFLGSSTVQVVGSNAVFPQACAFGLLAWLLLDGHRSRTRDALASAALALSILSLEVGVAFAIGAAVWIVLDTSRPLRRLWIPALPLLGYAAWYLWSRQFGEHLGTLENVLLAPQWAADSLGAASAALSGLSADLVDGGPPTGRIAAGWGYPLAAILVLLLVLAVRRERLRPAIAAPLALLVVLWVAGALNFGFLRTPYEARYVFPIALGVLLVAAECLRPLRLSRRAILLIVAAATLSLAGNLWAFREVAKDVRADSSLTQAQLAMVDLERASVDPERSLGFELASVTAGEYLAAADRYGTVGFTPAEIPGQSLPVRQQADSMLAEILTPALDPARDRVRGRECGAAAEPGASVSLPAGGAVVRSDEGGGVLLGRFAERASIEVGALRAGEAGVLSLPADGLPSVAWFVAPTDPGQTVTICELPSR